MATDPPATPAPDVDDPFHRLLESLVTVAVQGYALDGTVRYWNRASECFYGYSMAEAMGRNLLDLIIPPEMRERVRRALRHMAQTGIPIPAEELRLIRKDGSRISVFSSHAIITPPGKETLLYCIDLDLTERKKAETRIQESESRLLLALKVAQMGHWRYDCATQAVEWFSGHDRLFGLPLDQFGGHLDDVQEQVHPDDRQHGIDHLQWTLETGAPFDNVYRVIHPDGTLRWLHSYGHLFRDEQDRPHYIFGVTQDITDRKQSDIELDRHRHRLRELADDLTQTEERQRRGIALRLHDGVGQLLTVALMKLNEAESLAADSNRREPLVQIRTLVEQALRDTRSLTGELSPPLLYDAGLVPALEWLLDQFRSRHPGHRFHLVQRAEPACIKCRILFYQVARELLLNVIKHAHAQQVWVSLESAADRFMMQVRDDGVGGIPCHPLDGSSSHLGFGLFSIRERIHLFDGTLTIDSPPGGGTSISMTSPCRSGHLSA